MGQVWTKADCDGIRELNHKGGFGGPLAVTAQNPGNDGEWNTSDDLLSPMNQSPGNTTVDSNANDNCQDSGDRCRGFAGKHEGGVIFAFADGSARLLSESVDQATYRALSTINGSEITAGE